MEVTTELLVSYFDKLWPIPRSITGDGFKKSLDIISELIPLTRHYWNSGEHVHDWVIPPEYNISGAAIWRVDPWETVLDFRDNNLHVVGYSIPVHGVLPWRELREYVHTVPELPNALPYITSYFAPRFGFCMKHNQYMELEKEPDVKYSFFIDSTLESGQLVVGDLVVRGKTSDEIFLSSYLCHPSLANDNLSGPLVLAGVYQKLKDMELNHTLRFYIGPENIGMVAYLRKFGQYLIENLHAGLVIHCVGLGPDFSYKKSRKGNTVVDQAAINVLKRKGPLNVEEYFPDGSDERQLCSPGYNLPVGVFSRVLPWKYPEYHTSLDNKDLISFDTMMESVDTIVDIVLTIDKNKTYCSTIQYGTPMFAKCPEDIYASTMRLNSFYRGEGHRQAMLEIINASDGYSSLLHIAERYNRRMLDIVPITENLVRLGYLE